MQAVVIENGIVTNVIEVDSLGALPGVELIDPQGNPAAVIGATYDGTTFTAPVVTPYVPQSVSRFQALAALSNAGLLAQVQAAVAASTDPLVALAWNNAQSFDRDSAILATLSSSLNWTSAQLDGLFMAAAQISA